MNLEQLRVRHPLRESDFAAIRARVKAEIAQREGRPWLALLLRFAFAASLPLLFVPLVRERAPEIPVVVATRTEPAAPVPAEAPAPSRHLRRPENRSSATSLAAVRREPPARQAPVSRIEIVTADPAIRIIWLTPKENS